MVIFVMLSMVLALTLPTIRSKPCSRALFRDGVLGLSSSLLSTLPWIAHCSFRCTANPRHSFEGDSNIRCQKHTDFLVEHFGLGVLWDEYGIVGDVTVSFPCVRRDAFSVVWYYIIHSHLRITFPELIFTSSYHRIYSIRWSKARLRIIWWLGCRSTLKKNMERLKRRR